MKKEFDLLVFIGRFQPFHIEHERIVYEALQKAENVLVLVGSSFKARTIRNPFTFEEREAMIRSCFHGDGLHIRPLRDIMYNDTAWIKQVQNIVAEVAESITNCNNIGLIGASKDSTSYYLKLFPKFSSVNVPIMYDNISSTHIREEYFTGINVSLVPKPVSEFLQTFSDTSAFSLLVNEYYFVKKYKKSWEAAPYPVKHITVDAVVEQSGHVLVVKRRSEPGKGLWAIPGGHLEMDETLMEGAIRELKEETKIKVPTPVLRGSIINTHFFDNPHRSTIGRVITAGFHFKLSDDISLPKVKGSDDAEKAKWLPISDIREDAFYDDHFHIINYFLGI